MRYLGAYNGVHTGTRAGCRDGFEKPKVCGCEGSIRNVMVSSCRVTVGVLRHDGHVLDGSRSIALNVSIDILSPGI